MVLTRTFLLMGSGEFEPWAAEIERAALDARTGPVAVLPTASSTDGDTVSSTGGAGWGSITTRPWPSRPASCL